VQLLLTKLDIKMTSKKVPQVRIDFLS